MKFFLLIAILSIINFSFSQSSYNISELEPTKGKTRGSKFVGIDDDGYIYTLSIKSTYIVITSLTKSYLKVFNANTGKIHAEVPLEGSKELKSRGYEYLSMRFIDGKPTVICKEIKSDKPEKYYGINISSKGRLIGDPFEVGVSGDCSGFGRRGKSFFSGVYQFKGENGEATFISNITCRKDELKTYRVLELGKDLEVENTFTFKLSFDAVSGLSYERGKGDDYSYLKVQTRDKKDVDGKLFKRWVTTQRLYKIDRSNGDLEEIMVEEQLEPMKIGDFRLKATDQGVILSGQIVEEKGFSGLFTATVNERTNEITDIKTKNFDIDFVTKYWSDRQKKKEERRRDRKGETEDDENFSTNFKFMETFKTSDDGLLSVFQDFQLRVVTRTTTDANGVTTTTTDYYYYYKDVIVVKTGKDGEIEYTKLLPFYQLTVNYNPGKGYSALQVKNDIYFLHGTSNEMSDMIEEGKKSKRRSKRRDRRIQFASITHLDNNGEIDTEQVLDLRERNVSIDPNNVATDKKNKQFVIVSPVMKMFNFKKTKVIRIEL